VVNPVVRMRDTIDALSGFHGVPYTWTRRRLVHEVPDLSGRPRHRRGRARCRDCCRST
jgi:hypothetical protein